MSSRSEKVLALLREKPMTRKEIAAALGVHWDEIGNTMSSLRTAGRIFSAGSVERERGAGGPPRSTLWRAKETPKKPEPEYDEETCVTAGALRSAGFVVPESIPDCGWVPRVAMKSSVGTPTMEGMTVRCPVSVHFSQPFRWVETGVTVTEVEPGESR